MAGALGYPFRAVVDYRDYAYTWCKSSRSRARCSILRPDEVMLLPPECQGPKA